MWVLVKSRPSWHITRERGFPPRTADCIWLKMGVDLLPFGERQDASTAGMLATPRPHANNYKDKKSTWEQRHPHRHYM